MEMDDDDGAVAAVYTDTQDARARGRHVGGARGASFGENGARRSAAANNADPFDDDDLDVGGLGGGGGGGGADDVAAAMLGDAGGGSGGGEGGNPLPDAPAAGSGAEPDVVMDVARVPLAGFEWIQALEPPPAVAAATDESGAPVAPSSEYCYVCNTVPSAQDTNLALVSSLFARTRDMDDQRIVDLVHSIYERAIRHTGARPRPKWTKSSILAHMKVHAPTPESLVMDAVRVSTALLRPFLMTGRRVDPATGKELPPDDRHTRACLNVLSMRMRAATQLASMLDRAGGGAPGS